MSYTINHFNGNKIATVVDGTINNTLDITLIGKNYAGYGQSQNENFVYLLENFAGSIQPASPIAGQVWFDTGANKLRFYDGSRFRVAGSAEALPNPTPPAGPAIGDFWFDTTNNQLNVYNGGGSNSWTVVGPMTSSTNSGTTQFQISTKQEQTTGTGFPVIQAVLGTGNTVFAISNSSFTLNTTTSQISGFTDLKQGITLNSLSNTNGVYSSTNYKFWGTATDSDALGGVIASSYVRNDVSPQFAQLVRFSDTGYNVGTILSVANSTYSFLGAATSSTPIFKNNVSGVPLVFQTKTGASTVTTLQLLGNVVYPGALPTANIGATDIGTNTAYFGNMYANAFNVHSADLAEQYLADTEYDVGTVVTIGGEKEITACALGQPAIGVISGNPGIKMNMSLEGGTYVALKGRVPVKVIGPVTKGNRIKPYGSGWAKAITQADADTFGVAMESSSEAGVKIIECVIL